MTAEEQGSTRLEKRLGLLDVYAICTGAMFASGFFLLPGIAFGNAGPAVVAAYLISSVLMVPGMFSIAELSSAMPRAAGTYFFIHRSLGPLAGTIGGFGDWLVLTFKSAFALVGMGAYLTLFFDVPVRPVAIGLTVAFGALNIFGAKETARLQVWLVVVLLAIMTFFLAAGAFQLLGEPTGVVGDRFDPFLTAGSAGLVSTVGLVFISYAGLTKVAAAAEEIDNLDRNLPLAMVLALLTIGVIYVGGVFILVGSLDASVLTDDLTPVATSAEQVLGFLPGPLGVGLIVLAAVTAFASTGNAGILTASRYPLAMARDRLTWSGFGRLGRFGTPTVGIIATCALMIASIVLLDVERLASLGSAFLLLMFAFINLSVIIMRESRVSSYGPGFRSPLYPWMQIVGIVTTTGLLFTLGLFYVVFVTVIMVGAGLWYRFYAKGKVPNRGAIYGLFKRLGEREGAAIDEELWSILQERGASEEDSFDELVTRAHVLDVPGRIDLADVLGMVADEFRGRLERPLEGLDEQLSGAVAESVVPDRTLAAVTDLARDDLDRHEIVLVRAQRGMRVNGARRFPGSQPDHAEESTHGAAVQALIFLVGPDRRVTQHLRLFAQLVTMVEEGTFSDRWRRAHDDQELLETLLRGERFASLVVGSEGPPAAMVDKRLRDLVFPGNTLVALVRRGDQTIVPSGETLLRAGDRITVIGAPVDVAELRGRG
jgi:basic amino acid/polyamine antiporter, APA family